MADSHPLDLLFLDPQRGGAYLASEMLIGAIWSSLYALSCALLLWNYHELSWRFEYWLSVWLASTGALRVCDVGLKVYFWSVLSSLINTYEDRRFTTRKLMQFVRCPSFHWLSRLSVATYIFLFIGIVRLWTQSAIGFATVCHVCQVLICFSILKFLVSLCRFYGEFAEAQKRHPEDSASFLETGASLEQIAELPVFVLSSTLEANGVSLLGRSCAICIEEFVSGVRVKALRCSATHVFHEECIDRWLIEMEACPLCTADLQKK